MHVAAEIFPVRYVCGFGRNAPDGLVPFDDLFTADKLDPIPAIEGERAGRRPARISRSSPGTCPPTASCRSRAAMPS